MHSGHRDQLDFYRSITPFSDFSGVSNLANYHPAPDDWYVVIADIVGSTKAIARGRYKDVNMIGAACITAVLNATKELDIPYVFGGDGATMMVPPQAVPAVSAALERLQSLAARNFDFTLRAGLMPVSAIRRLGSDVLVAKMALSPGNYLAMLTGGGIALTDQKIKEGAEDALLLQGTAEDENPDLTGLSCRWEPLESTRGRMASILIKPQAAESHARAREIEAVLDRLQAALSDRIDSLRPTSTAKMIFKWPPRELRLEALMTRGRQSLRRRFWYLYLETLLQKLADLFDLKVGDFSAPAYQDELRSNTDFRRFDDTLRLVLDCTEAQIEAIRTVLDQFQDEGRIRYGLHLSSHALMTCLVFSLADHEHIHFIDGSDGGFAIAAKAMKTG